MSYLFAIFVLGSLVLLVIAEREESQPDVRDQWDERLDRVIAPLDKLIERTKERIEK